MCRLKIKLKITGSKYHKFKQILILPRNFLVKSNFKQKIGFWDTRTNKHIRYITINLYQVLVGYKYGLTPNKTTLNILYYYFIKKIFNNLNGFFSDINLNYF